MTVQFLVLYQCRHTSSGVCIHPMRVEVLQEDSIQVDLPSDSKIQPRLLGVDEYEDGYIYDLLSLEDLDDLASLYKVYFSQRGPFYESVLSMIKTFHVTREETSTFHCYGIYPRSLFTISSESTSMRDTWRLEWLYPVIGLYDATDTPILLRLCNDTLTHLPFADETVEHFFSRN